ncbi:MAG: sugar transferase [Acidobacteria bacterium]|nr:sugar transferase [Acidobacteriota bacterium]
MEGIRRVLDVLLGAAGLVLLSPLFLVCALAIRLGSAGRVLYRQDRVGRHGRRFRIYKFRSMVANTDESELLVTGEEDPRITRAGRWLRRYKLDELPQLFNVLRGDMSLVGPRPRVEKYARHYPEDLREVLLAVRPGITDSATLRAIQQERRLGRVPAAERERYYLERILPGEVRMNVEDIRRRTIASYFGILVRTVFLLLRGGGEGALPAEAGSGRDPLAGDCREGG